MEGFFFPNPNLEDNFIPRNKGGYCAELLVLPDVYLHQCAFGGSKMQHLIVLKIKQLNNNSTLS